MDRFLDLISELGRLPALLLPWYDKARRRLPWREDPSPYHTWLSEIMLQQTRVEAVIPYYQRFLRELPTIGSLAKAEEERLYKLWEGLGYYSRVRNMQKAARVVCEKYGGMLPPDEQTLKTLPGIGDYTAGAIASIAFGRPAPAVDGNVLRVLSRFMAYGEDISAPAARKEMQALVRAILPVGRPGDFNQALMELGATVCLPNGAPSCGSCPLAAGCRGFEGGNPCLYPVKAQKKARPVQPRTVVLFCCGTRLFLNKRPAKGLLANLWEPYTLEGSYTKAALKEALNAQGISPQRICSLGRAKHIFTHLEWEMDGFYAALPEPVLLLSTGEWVTWRQLKETHAVPGAFRPFFERLEREAGSPAAPEE